MSLRATASHFPAGGGRSDRVAYGFAVFKRSMDIPAAVGHFVQVYVDAETRRPKPLLAKLTAVVENLKAG